MENAMSWNNSANTRSEYVEPARRLMRKVVGWYRRYDSLKADYAIERGARDLGLSDRRARSLVRDEPVSISEQRFLRMQERYRASAMRRSLELLAEAEALMAEVTKEESRQLELNP